MENLTTVALGMPEAYVIIAKYFAAALVMAAGAVGASISQGKISAKACESISASPQSEKAIRNIFFTGLLFVETSSIYCLIIAAIFIFF